MTKSLKDRLVEKSLEEGFGDVGFCTPHDIPEAKSRLASFVDRGLHGQMKWMGERLNWRGDPHALWPEAKSVVMLAELYTPHHDPIAVTKQKDRAAISAYAMNKDYHDIVKKRLKRVGRWLLDESPGTKIKVFVDTAPVMEKPLAAAAGLGWQGKHTNLVSPNLGNWFFLGSIFSTVEFEADEPGSDNCGSCSACLDICPTNAFLAPYQLDAQKCISYLTIEHSGPVEKELRSKIGNRIYGCDDCLAICPWNKFAKSASEIRYVARPDLISPRLEELVTLDDAQFRERFSGSPIKRSGRNRFVRNVLYAIGNSGDARMIDSAKSQIEDPDEGIRDAAIWAVEGLQQIS